MTSSRRWWAASARRCSSSSPRRIGEVRLSLSHVAGGAGQFKDISLNVRAGEIVGLYGFVGAGRSEFAQGLFGLHAITQRRSPAGRQALHAQVAAPGRARGPRLSPRGSAGAGGVPDAFAARQRQRDHFALLSRAGLVRARSERDLAAQVIAEMSVRASSIEQPIGTLSGGNQQKVIFGRWQAAAPKVLILDEPTRGVDVGAKAEIHKLICGLAAQGTAILLISSELPEVIAMSDRVITLSEGRTTGVFDPKTDSREAIAAAAVPKASAGAAEARKTSAFARMLRMREIGLLACIGVLASSWRRSPTSSSPRQPARRARECRPARDHGAGRDDDHLRGRHRHLGRLDHGPVRRAHRARREPGAARAALPAPGARAGRGFRPA
jgi:ABC-type multidrug transport system ATPase subunit